MIITDVSAVIPYILYKDQTVEEVILTADRIISPVLYTAECGNTLLQYVKNDLISIAEAQDYLNQSLDLIDHLVDVSDHGKAVMTIAYENQLSFYDAEYLFLTIASNGKLLSRDKKLNKIANKHGVDYKG